MACVAGKNARCFAPGHGPCVQSRLAQRRCFPERALCRASLVQHGIGVDPCGQGHRPRLIVVRVLIGDMVGRVRRALADDDAIGVCTDPYGLGLGSGGFYF